MACVQPYAVNPFNFLRWHPAANTTLPFPVPLEYCQPGLPACGLALNYLEGQDYPLLPAVAGDEIQFFINSQDGIDITNGFASVALGLAQDGKLVTPLAGDLFNIPDPTSATSFFLYGTLRIDCQPDGRYWPILYDKNDRHVLLIANPIEVANRQHWLRDTVLVKFRHPFSLYGVDYSTLDGFYQQFRLSLSMQQPTLPWDETTYTDRNNYTRRTRLQITQVYELNSDFWDVDMFRAAALMLTHDEVYIASLLVKAQGALEPNYIDGGEAVGWLTAKGKVQDLNFARTVLSC